MDIRLLKESNGAISKNTILSLLSDVFLKKIEDVRNFSPVEVYYKDDIVYMYNAQLDKHELYSCLKDGVTGPFNPNDWDDLIINMGGVSSSDSCSNVRCVESIFVQTYVATENTNVIPLEKQFDYTRDSIMVFHSTMGLLSRDEYKVNDLGSSIRLRRRILSKNESITYYMFVGGDGKIGYNSFDENVQYADVEGKTEFKINLDYKPFTDILMVFNSVNILIPPTEYTILNNKVILKKGIGLDEKLTMVSIGKDYDNDMIVQIYQSTSKIPASGTRNVILPFKNNSETQFMVFHSLEGLVTTDHYTVENGRITFDFDLNINEELYFIVTSRKVVITNITESSSIMSVTSKDIDEELYSHIVGDLGRVTLTKQNPKKTIVLDMPVTSKTYDVDIHILESDGDVGDVIVTNKDYSGFDIEFNGIAKNVLIEYVLRGVIGIQKSTRVSEFSQGSTDSEYQTKIDDELETDEKSIVGAINELNAKLESKISYEIESDGVTMSIEDNAEPTPIPSIWLHDGKLVTYIEGIGHVELVAKPIDL